LVGILQVIDAKRILLVITGGIAAYKSLDLIRRLKDRGCDVRCILTENAKNFVTPLSVATLSGNRVFQDLFSLTDELEIGHITLARECDLVVVAPATANMLAKMALGLADDLASTALLACDRPILVAPAMNTRMWTHPATQANLQTLKDRGVHFVGPESGFLAEGETGIGRMSEVPAILARMEEVLGKGPLAGIKALVTSGPTHEPIDPVRVIANRSSGKQGHAIAQALADLGADVTLISGPVAIADPKGCRVVKVETAQQMLAAAQAALPADVVVCAAAVADWRVDQPSLSKRKKKEGEPAPTLSLVQNPDILATLSDSGPNRPRLVVGFAAETDSLIDNAKLKLARKGCDLIIANDVSAETGTFGGEANHVYMIDAGGVQEWPALSKSDVAKRLAELISRRLEVTS
jgi:phosphopantothenoylcysteine decarboxylase/phosphopantothenate--cysteine ligase